MDIPESFEVTEENVTSYLEDMRFVELVASAVVKGCLEEGMLYSYRVRANEVVDYAICNCTGPYQAAKLLNYSPTVVEHQIVIYAAKLLYEQIEP